MNSFVFISECNERFCCDDGNGMIGRIKLFIFDCPVVAVGGVVVVGGGGGGVRKSAALEANGGDDNGAKGLVLGFAIIVDNGCDGWPLPTTLLTLLPPKDAGKNGRNDAK